MAVGQQYNQICEEAHNMNKENNMVPTVFIVHHIDTEGPLFESIEETFKRIYEITGKNIPLEATKENLKKIQNGHGLDSCFSTDEIEKIKGILSPHLLQYKTSWAEVDEMLFRILSEDFRYSFKDSYGNGWIYNWHILDHVGYEVNPRHRDLGYLNIYDHYIDILRQTNSLNIDEINWHFHPIPYTKQANLCGTSYENCYSILHQILCRRLIERNWFPLVHRPGFHTERPDSNWFLEQWIPFDAANQSIKNDDYDINGRFGDWKGAPDDWSIYKPDIYDWRKKGNCNRYIARVLNLNTRFRNITIEEIQNAFSKAREEQTDVYLGITDHDFREISKEIKEFYDNLLSVSREFGDVKYCFSKASSAFRSVLKINSGIEKELKMEADIKNNLLTINIKQGEPFGPQPYLAIKTKSGDYIHDNLDFGEFKKQYYYTFDIHTILLKNVEQLKIASNDKFGNQCIIKVV